MKNTDIDIVSIYEGIEIKNEKIIIPFSFLDDIKHADHAARLHGVNMPEEPYKSHQELFGEHIYEIVEYYKNSKKKYKND